MALASLEFCSSLIQDLDTKPFVFLSKKESIHVCIAIDQVYDLLVDTCLARKNINVFGFLPHLNQIRTLRISKGELNLEYIEPRLDGSRWHRIFPAWEMQKTNPLLYQVIDDAKRYVCHVDLDRWRIDKDKGSFCDVDLDRWRDKGTTMLDLKAKKKKKKRKKKPQTSAMM